jgi:peptidoglycan/xylan/chitin deacetylase (PgdA/CDA1 family)
MNWILNLLLLLVSNQLLNSHAYERDADAELEVASEPESSSVISGCTRPGVFAMTFDDGPYEYSPQLLAGLKRYNVKATFFLVGELVENPDYAKFVQQMVLDGHQVASHTYTHPHLNSLSDAEIEEEIQKSQDAIYDAIGYRVTFFRCPYGECDDRVVSILETKGYKIIHWNLDTKDWDGKTSDEIVSVYEDTLQSSNSETDSFIALEHEIAPETVAALPELIRKVRRSGYQLVTVANCI